MCNAGDQWCSDSIVQSMLGGIGDASTNWQNRPTYQQVVEYPARLGDNLANLALKVQVSQDGVTWRTVWSTSAGDGGIDNDGFAPTTGRYVRMQGVSRATTYGYSIYEMEVYAQ